MAISGRANNLKTSRWFVLVDWERTGAFAGAYDDITNDVRDTLSWSYGLQPGRHMTAGHQISITVDNEHRQFSPENTESPLYGKMRPGTPVKIFHKEPGPIGWNVTFGAGIVWKIIPAPLQFGKRTAQIIATDYKMLLEMADYYPFLMQNVTGDEVIKQIFKNVALPTPPVLSDTSKLPWKLGVPGRTKLGADETTSQLRLGSITDYVETETGTVTFDYVGDNAHNDDRLQDLVNYENRGIANRQSYISAWRLIQDVTEAERGYFFFDRDGVAQWWNRNHFLDSTEDPARHTDDFQDANYEIPDFDTYNRFEVRFSPREQAGDETVIYTRPIIPNFPGLHATAETIFSAAYLPNHPRNEIEFEAVYDGKVSATDIVTPVLNVDYTFDEDAGAISVLSFKPLAEKAIVKLRNISTTEHSFLTSFQIRGKQLNVTGTGTANAENLTSDTEFIRTLRLNTRLLSQQGQAVELAAYERLMHLVNPPRLTEITYRGIVVDDPNLYAWSKYEVGDRLRLSDTQTGHLTGWYFICGIRYSLDTESKVLTTTYILEPDLVSRMTYYPESNQDSDTNLNTIALGYTHLAQSFTVPYNYPVGLVRLYLKKIGSPSGNLQVRIYIDDAGQIGELYGASPLYSVDEVSAVDYGWQEFRMTGSTPLSTVETYWIVLVGDYTASNTNYVQWGADASSPGYADGAMKYGTGALETVLTSDNVVLTALAEIAGIGEWDVPLTTGSNTSSLSSLSRDAIFEVYRVQA